MQKYISNSVEETKRIAAKLTKQIPHGVIALTGELGAGKTTFVQGFAKGLGIQDKIISPTFVLIRQHPIPNTTRVLYHIDLYRLEDVKSFQQLGLEEIWSNPNNIVLIEWAEKLKQLPKGTIKISIQKEGSDKRRLIIESPIRDCKFKSNPGL